MTDRDSDSAPLRVKRFASSGAPFPPERISALPHTIGNIGFRSKLSNGSTGAVASYVRSRYGLTDALRASGVGPGTAVLIPAYHCLTMVDPGIRLGAHTLLYPLTKELAPCRQQLDALIEQRGNSIKAFLLPHYFGLLQDIRAWADWAAERGIALIEDCSHCLPYVRAQGVGTVGKFSIWSPYKFYPCEDGGELFISDPRQVGTVPRTTRTNLARQCRSALEWVKRRMRTSPSHYRIDSLDDEISQAIPLSTGCAIESEALYDRPSSQYLIEEERASALPTSRWIARHIAQEPIVDLRRKRWKQWCDATAKAPGCTPFRVTLGPNEVPYMFPLQVTNPDVSYFLLRRLGLAVWRWDSMALSRCPVSAHFRLHLFQLPCHQDIDDVQMEWMISAVNKVMRRTQEQGDL